MAEDNVWTQLTSYLSNIYLNFEGSLMDLYGYRKSPGQSQALQTLAQQPPQPKPSPTTPQPPPNLSGSISGRRGEMKKISDQLWEGK